MEIKLKKLKEGAVVPSHGSDLSAGYDIYACVDKPVTICSGCTALIPIGWAMQPPEGYYIAIVARSGLAAKYGIRLANCYAVCDEDYRGEYMVPLYNDGPDIFTVHNGDRIAQMLLKQYNTCEFKIVSELENTSRGEGGFGSTGVITNTKRCK